MVIDSIPNQTKPPAIMQVVNYQRKITLDIKALQEFLILAGKKIDEIENRTATVAFISDRKMRQLNKQFRGKNSTTDVLSFPYEPYEFLSNKLQFVGNEPANLSLQNCDFLGDIVISAEQTERQAKENGLTLENEIKQLILHGLLHLCGYDHETDNGEMNARELELRDKLGI